MMRYAEVPWPWAGLTLALGLLAQEALLRFFDDGSSLALTSWRILVMTLGVTSLALIILPPRRPAYLLGRKGGPRLWVDADGSGTLLRAVGAKSEPLELSFSEWDRAGTFTEPPPSKVIEN